MRARTAAAFAALILLPAQNPPPGGLVIELVLYPVESGVASVYANGDGHEWTKNANGGRVDPRRLTAAHRTLPFGTIVEVLNLKNGKTVDVCIDDRGPFRRGRIVDLTPAGAKALGFSGLAKVELAVVSFPAGAPPARSRACRGYEGSSGRK